MEDSVQIAAWEGGKLRIFASGDVSHEAVLALPLNRLIVRVLRVPSDFEGGAEAFAKPLLQAASPFPDETLTVSCETVRTDDRGSVVIAAALPEGSTDDIATALDSAKLNITRVDAVAIGALRGLWETLGTDDGERRLLVISGADCISLVILDGDGPSAIRAVSSLSSFRREVVWSLLEAEDFGGAKQLKEIVVAHVDGTDGVDASELVSLAPVRTVEIGADAALVGIAERTAEEGSLNALPESWREMLDETRFKSKLVRRVAVAGTIWALLLGVFIGVPFAFDMMTDHQKEQSKRHEKKYLEVKDMRDKALLVAKYSDHARGALEIMKAVSDRLPPSITLGSMNFKRGEGVRVNGEAEVKDEVYALKDALAVIRVTDDDGVEVPLFGTVKLSGPSSSRGGFKFDLDCRYEAEEESK